MATLFCFGLGYSASHYIHEFGGRFDRIAGTVTTREKVAAIAGAGIGGRKVEAFVFDGTDAPPEVTAALMDAAALLVLVPPDDGDPVLRQFASTIAGAPQLQSIVYLSTIGVYGDHGGAWIDETTPPVPISERSRARLAAEKEWQALGARSGKSAAVLRLSGIYGPSQNALLQVARRSAKRIDKPGQVFNRIHAADISGALWHLAYRDLGGVFNVTDDEPAPPQDVVAYAADLMRQPPPPEIPFDAAQLSPMARSFYGENKRVSNRLMREGLGHQPLYPTYREGLAACLSALEGP
jgi:hypothetical protein